MWQDGTGSNSIRWDADQPKDDDPLKDCVTIDMGGTLMLSTDVCSAAHPFICRRRKHIDCIPITFLVCIPIIYY